MGIQVGNHAADGTFQELGVVNRLYVFALHTGHDLGQRVRMLPRRMIVIQHLALGEKPATE